MREKFEEKQRSQRAFARPETRRETGHEMREQPEETGQPPEGELPKKDRQVLVKRFEEIIILIKQDPGIPFVFCVYFLCLLCVFYITKVG